MDVSSSMMKSMRDAEFETMKMSILKAPLEDTIWIVKLSYDETGSTLLEVTIRNSVAGYYVGSFSVDPVMGLSQELLVLRAISKCVMNPKKGKPRRPRYFTFQPSSPKLVCFLAECGLNCIENSPKTHRPSMDKISAGMRTCSLCRMRGEEELFISCPQCRVVFYCSDECLNTDMREDSEHRHLKWCDNMASYAAESCKLADFPFAYTNVTTDEKFTNYDYHEFLRSEGVLHQGYWRREVNECSECPRIVIGERSIDVPFGTLEDDNLDWVLPSESVALECPVSDTSDSPLLDWQAYYKHVGLHLDSPIAALLTFPLTLYYIVTSLHIQQSNISDIGKTCVVHIVGAEKEVDMLPAFSQLGMLLPNIQFYLVFIGPKIDKKVHGRILRIGNVDMTVYSQRYEKILQKVNLAVPDFIIGFNAGLAAYRSWGKALVEIAKKKIPAFFTDYCLYSCACSSAPMEGLKLGRVSQPVINPFRSPIRRFSEENKMPMYSNAYIFSLTYNETVDSNAWAMMELSKILQSNLRLEKEGENSEID